MSERIIRIVEEAKMGTLTFTIAETAYEYGTHYVLFSNGLPGFHSTDLDRVREYMNEWLSMYYKK